MVVTNSYAEFNEEIYRALVEEEFGALKESMRNEFEDLAEIQRVDALARKLGDTYLNTNKAYAQTQCWILEAYQHISRNIALIRGLDFSAPNELELIISYLQCIADNAVDSGTTAAAYLHMGRVAEGAYQLERAVSFYETSKRCEENAAILLAEVELLLEVRRPDQAESSQLKLQELFALEAEPTIKANIANTVGGWYQVRHEYGNAISWFETAIAIEQNDVSLKSKIYSNLASALRAHGEPDESRKYFEKAYAFSKAEGNGCPTRELILIMNNWGEALRAVGLHEEAREMFDDASVKLRKMIPDDYKKSPLYAKLENNLGSIYLVEFGFLESAIEHLEQAANSLGFFLESGHPELSITHKNLGLAYFESGEKEKAHIYLSKARKGVGKYLPADSELVEAIVSDCDALLEKLNLH